jgi:alpha 1,2-mannosyltransferase
LWHLAGEVTDTMRALLLPYDVTCVDADQITKQRPFRFLDGHRWKGWQLKPYAIAACRFQEVLFLDADCYPTRNPEFLFEWPAYRKQGAIFWPDLETSAYLLPPELWEVFGTQPGWLPLDSGQILINKRKCWRELHLALWYNAHADLVYHLLYGDKDTFNIAWRRLGTSYSMPQTTSAWDIHTILQYAPDGTVLFQHRCQDKFRLEGDEFSNNQQKFSRNTRNPRLVLEDDCFGFLADLKRRMKTARAVPDAEQVQDGDSCASR